MESSSKSDVNIDVSEQTGYLEVRYSVGTDVGRKRTENQDSYGVIKGKGYQILFVADGMGGANGGALASSLAVSSIEKFFRQPNVEFNQVNLLSAVQKANAEIFIKGSSDNSLSGMGTTIVGLGFIDNHIFVFNVGDSRAYRFSNGKISQLTSDHTLVQELVRAGSISPEQAEDHPVSHMLTRSLGPSADVQVDCDQLENGMIAGDRFLLCSDGLYNMVPLTDIEDILNGNSIDDAIQMLIKKANDNGGSDNITAIVIEVNVKRKKKSSLASGIVQKTSPKEVSKSELGKNQPSDRLNEDSNPQTSIFPQLPSFKKFEAREFLIVFFTAFIAGYLLRYGSFRESDSPKQAADNKIFKEVAQKPERELFPFRLSYNENITPEISAPHLSVIVPQEAAINVDNGRGGSSEGEDNTRVANYANGSTLPNDLIKQEKLSLLVDIENKIKALNQPISGESTQQYDKTQQKLQSIELELIQVGEELDTATRKLTLWFNRSKELSVSDPLNFVNEVAVTSDDVKSKKDFFEKETWEYLKLSEALKLDPNDKDLNQKIRDSLKSRNESMRTLAASVRSTIQLEASKSEQEIVAISAKKAELEKLKGSLNKELEYFKALISAQPEAIEHVKQDLLNQKEVIQSELQGL